MSTKLNTDNKRYFPLINMKTAGLSGLVSLMIAHTPALAGNLDEQDFGNEVKNLMADAVQIVCGGFVGNNNAEDGIELDENQTQLFTRCRQMVHTANELEGSGPTGDSLGLTQEELGDAMKALASEEVGVQGDWANRSNNQQLANMKGRFAALRSGATGLSLNGLRFQNNDGLVVFSDSWLEQPTQGGNAGDGSSKLGVFVNGNFSTGDRDSTELQTGYDLDSIGITAGLDYRFTPELVLGFAIGLTDTETDFDNNEGSQDIEGLNYTLYGTYSLGDLYLDASISAGQQDYDSTRLVAYADGTVNTTPRASTEGDLLNGYIALGYNLPVDQLQVSAYGQLHYVDIEIDGFEETGGNDPSINMAVEDQSVDSLQTVIGAQLAKNLSTDWGVIVPYAKLDWHHEFEDDSRTTVFQYVFDPFNTNYTLNTDEPDSDYFVAGLGTNLVFDGGQVFVDYQTPLGLKDVTNHAFTIGAKLDF